MEELRTILYDLVKISSPSGNEERILTYIKNYLLDLGLTYKEDYIGNVITCFDNNYDNSIMLVAHCDEIGFTIKYIDENGFIRISPLGGIDINILKGHRVNIMHNDKNVEGVIGALPPHFNKKQKNEFSYADIWIDIGVNNRDEAKKKVSIGDSITFIAQSHFIDNDLIVAKSLDNKISVAILLYIIKVLITCPNNKRSNISFVFSTQEEIGCRGAKVASYNETCNTCIVLDVTHATDYPSINKNIYGDIKLGEGPVIPFGANFTKNIQNTLREIALSHNYSIQVESINGISGTDSSVIQTMKGGYKIGQISIPCRYMHSPSEIVSLKDAYITTKILKEYLLS